MALIYPLSLFHPSFLGTWSLILFTIGFSRASVKVNHLSSKCFQMRPLPPSKSLSNFKMCFVMLFFVCSIGRTTSSDGILNTTAEWRCCTYRRRKCGCRTSCFTTSTGFCYVIILNLCRKRRYYMFVLYAGMRLWVWDPNLVRCQHLKYIFTGGFVSKYGYPTALGNDCQ